jgi:predicted methyltransferase
MLKRAFLFAACLALPLAAAQAAPADVAAAVSAPGRPAEAVVLDEVRKPAQVLGWLGLERGDRVLDYFTGTGYYAEIMARAVGPTGSVTGWNSSGFGRNEPVRTALAAIHERSPNTAFYFTPTTALSFAPNAYDFILLHLVYHDAYWESVQFGLPRIDPNTVTAALFRAVKPGGTVAVIDHIAAPGRETRAEVEANHRIDPATVRADFERAGFQFAGSSEMLRNPADDHSKNVFDPSIRGRTDRFVYRFRRPAR